MDDARITMRDTIFDTPLDPIAAFVFDEQVVSVFPDMIQRSVPAYSHVIAMTGVLADYYALPHSNVYDLGCSLGATLLAMRRSIRQPVQLIGVDTAPAMISGCQTLLSREGNGHPVELHCADAATFPLENASVIAMNFTLQFIPPEERLPLMTRIHEALLPNRVLLLSEKIRFDAPDVQARIVELHHHFKRANGYSDLEISQKRAALENVLMPNSLHEHTERLHQAGFKTIQTWFQSLNFAALLAIKA